MTTIDDKVVAASFESSKFESGVSKTLSAIDKLKAALKFPGAGKGLDEVNVSAKRINLSHIASGLADVSSKLGAFRLTAIAVFSQIATSAIRAGERFASAFTLDPVKAGFAEYSTNLNAVQTILANTAASGAKLADVNKALLELNRYSDKTIYNFSQMAKNIGTFTAAGVDLQTSTAAIKGIANLAALSGSNADQAATAMYQLSQAIASGRVSLMDWNSVVNAGMGGTVFQRALAQTAEAMGTLKDGAVKLEGPMKNVKINGESFRESIGGPGPKWLTSDVLTNTLKQFTSDMSVAELKAQGFNDAQIKAIQSTAKTAMKAATNVKTLSQVLDVAKETAGSGWAQTWQIIFGDFGEAKTLFTGVSNAINGFINASANARNKVLGDWKELGGRTILINSIKTAFQALGQILAPIKEAFREFFPAKTGKDLLDLTLKFKAFAEALKPSPETIANLHRTFAGLFAILDIGKQVLSGIFTVFKKVFEAVGGGSGSFLNFTGNIGDFLVSLDKALKKGDALHMFFVDLGSVLAVPAKLLGQLAHAIANLFSGFSPEGFSDKMASITKSMTPFQRMVKAIANALQELGPAIGNALAGINWETVLAVVRTGLFAGLVLMIKKFIGGTTLPQLFGIFGKSVGKSFGKGILGNLGKSFGSLSGSLKSMQQNLKAKTLKEIAIAIALLAVSVLALSLVDPEKLSGALGAMTVMFGELLGAMAIMDKITSSKSFVKLPVIAASMILLAGAIDLLTISVIAMSKLSWEQLSKGLAGVGALLGGLSAASVVLSKNAGGMIRSGIGIMAIAVSMKILASAMADFATMNWTQIAKGLAGVTGSLAGIAVAMQLMPKNLAIRSVALIAIAGALKILADVVTQFGVMNLTMIGKGLLGIGGGLAVIAGAMHLMPKNMILMGAGLLLVAASLDKIATAVGKMGAMSLEKLGKGLAGLAGSMIILAVALRAMAGTTTGAAALALAAAGLALLIPPLIALGKQSWTTLLKSMIGLGVTLGVIAVAARLLAPSIPALLGFGAALLVIGAGIALAGAGIAAIGIGLSAIAASGSVAIGILIGALVKLTEAIPEMAQNLVVGLLSIVQAFAKTAPQFVTAIVKIIESLLNAIIQSAPKIGQAFETLLLVALQVIANNAPKVIQAGFDLLMDLLNGIKNNIGQVTVAVVDIIVKFLGAVTNNLGRIVTAGAQLLVKFLLGIANNLSTVVTAVGTIITSFITAVGSNLGRIVTAGVGMIVKFITALGTQTVLLVTTIGTIITTFITEVGKQGVRIVTAGVDVIIKFIEGIGKNAVRLANAAGQTILDFLNGLTAAVETYAPKIRTASLKLGYAIIDGITGGMLSKADDLYEKAKGIAEKALGFLGKALDILSPSKATYAMGKFLVIGLTNGVRDTAPQLYGTMDLVGKRLLNTVSIASLPKQFQEIGAYITKNFAQGIRGSSEDINTAFTELNDKLTASMATARETITTEQAKLKALRDADKPDATAIKAAQDIIKQNQSILAVSTATHRDLVVTLRSEKIELLGLAKDYQTVGEKLKAAQDVLKTAIQTRNDAVQNFTNQYSTLPDIVTTDAEGNAVDTLATYMQALKNQADAVAAYQSTLDQLRQLGLDDATYQKLLQEGPEDQRFAEQLLAGGKTAVEALNTLDIQLMNVSKTLATNAARNLYQAGVDAAQGVVNGLRSKKHDLENASDELAQIIIQTLKRALDERSPSKKLAEIGAFAMQGLANGLSSSSKMVVDTMKKTINNLASLVADELTVTPTISPILDLTQVRAQSREMSSLLEAPIAAISAGQALAISAERTTVQEEAIKTTPTETVVKFEQNNYSPEALSEIEIYRQTKNQLSQIKLALANV